MKHILPTILAVLEFALPARAVETDSWARSLALEAKGDFQGAEEALAFQSGVRPRDEFILLRLGWLRYENKKYNASLHAYEAAIHANPLSIDARLGKSLPLLAQQKWREASGALQRVLELSPWDYTAHQRLMATQEALGQWEELRDHAEEVALRYPADAAVWSYLARAQAHLGDIAAARTAYRKALHRYPSNAEALRFLLQNEAPDPE